MKWIVGSTHPLQGQNCSMLVAVVGIQNGMFAADI
jgi:hypothetical protein